MIIAHQRHSLYFDTGILGLAGNEITGTLPTEIGLMSSLEEFNVGISLVSGTLPTELVQLRNLKELDVWEASLLTGTIPEEIYLADWPSLYALILGRCSFSGTISTNVGLLGGTVEFIYFNGNPALTGTIPTEIGLLTKLQKIHLDGSTGLSGSIPSELCHLRDSKLLTVVKADCSTLASGEVLMPCQEECCTKCCNQESGVCTKF